MQLGGPDKVAEITGRRGMLVRAASGKGVTYQARNTWVWVSFFSRFFVFFFMVAKSCYFVYCFRKDVTMEMVNMHEKQLFMDGKKLVAIISEAGSAGVSLQADRRAINQVCLFCETFLICGAWFFNYLICMLIAIFFLVRTEYNIPRGFRYVIYSPFSFQAFPFSHLFIFYFFILLFNDRKEGCIWH